MQSPFPTQSQPKVAILIDGDNARPTLLGKYLAEAGKYGTVTLRRIYGDWTTPNMKGWKGMLNDHAVQPIQQFRYTVGKNATDSALIIDAMDLLHSGLVDAFCLVSSDSDYTRLATRIREAGIFVMGIGENKTPKAFVNACNLFIYTENLLPKEPTTTKSKNGRKTKTKTKKPDPLPMLLEAYELASGEDDWVHLSAVGTQLQQLDPGFDPRTFGYRKLSSLFKAYSDKFELKFETDKGPSSIYVRLKE
ncbi:MAG: NYN domain-containing protein [Bacteroidetes bacterium]|nr:MAG: NYN domain-containing protein [Bacteroidota bacterium]